MELPKKTQPDAGEYRDSGFCSNCLLTIEAIQPGGLKPRHKSNHVPVGECAQAVAAAKQKAEQNQKKG